MRIAARHAPRPLRPVVAAGLAVVLFVVCQGSRCVQPDTGHGPWIPSPIVRKATGFTVDVPAENDNIAWQHYARPIVLQLTPGSRRLRVNDITVWLNAPPSNKRQSFGALHIVDVESSIRPLLKPWRAAPVPLRVMLDPGHGGEDSGTVSPGGLLVEKDLVLEIAAMVAERLRTGGLAVRLTREDDVAVDLSERTSAARSWSADLFVSIHLNASPNPSARGAETFVLPAPGFPSTTEKYVPGERPWIVCPINARSVLLAYSVHSRLPLRRKSEEDRGVRRGRFQVLRQAHCPAILIECGFVSNTRDARNLIDPQKRAVLAGAIATGILEYARRDGIQM